MLNFLKKWRFNKIRNFVILPIDIFKYEKNRRGKKNRFFHQFVKSSRSLQKVKIDYLGQLLSTAFDTVARATIKKVKSGFEEIRIWLFDTKKLW